MWNTAFHRIRRGLSVFLIFGNSSFRLLFTYRNHSVMYESFHRMYFQDVWLIFKCVLNIWVYIRGYVNVASWAHGSPLYKVDDNSLGDLGPAAWYDHSVMHLLHILWEVSEFHQFKADHDELPQTWKRAFWMGLLEYGPSPLLLVYFLYSYLRQSWQLFLL